MAFSLGSTKSAGGLLKKIPIDNSVFMGLSTKDEIDRKFDKFCSKFSQNRRAARMVDPDPNQHLETHYYSGA